MCVQSSKNKSVLDTKETDLRKEERDGDDAGFSSAASREKTRPSK